MKYNLIRKKAMLGLIGITLLTGSPLVTAPDADAANQFESSMVQDDCDTQVSELTLGSNAFGDQYCKFDQAEFDAQKLPENITYYKSTWKKSKKLTFTTNYGTTKTLKVKKLLNDRGGWTFAKARGYGITNVNDNTSSGGTIGCVTYGGQGFFICDTKIVVGGPSLSGAWKEDYAFAMDSAIRENNIPDCTDWTCAEAYFWVLANQDLITDMYNYVNSEEVADVLGKTQPDFATCYMHVLRNILSKAVSYKAAVYTEQINEFSENCGKQLIDPFFNSHEFNFACGYCTESIHGGCYGINY